MDMIRRWRPDAAGKYRAVLVPVYTCEEAVAKGITFVHWREVKKGEWALTDDGYVCECFNVYGPYPNKKGEMSQRLIVLACARAWDQPTMWVSYEDRIENKAWGRVATCHWAESDVKSPAGKRFVLAYAYMFMAGTGIDLYKLGCVYRTPSSNHNPVQRAKHLLTQEAYKRMIEQKLVELLTNKKITRDSVAEMMTETYEMAKTGKIVPEMRKMTEMLAKILDMFPKEGTKQIPGGYDGITAGKESDASFEDVEKSIEAADEELSALPDSGQAVNDEPTQSTAMIPAPPPPPPGS